MNEQELDFVITKQGTPVVNLACFLTTFEGEPEAVIVSLDMVTKHTQCFGYGESEEGVPTYDICGRELITEDEFDFTTVSFPSLKGYQIVAYTSGRYTHTLAFMKKPE